MDSYTRAAMERAMKVQEVILRAAVKQVSWWQAAEIIGISGGLMIKPRKIRAGQKSASGKSAASTSPGDHISCWLRQRAGEAAQNPLFR